MHQGQKLQCDYEATQKGSLATHRKSLHLGQKFHCPYCDFEATRKGSRATHHKSVHLGQKFLCPDCDYEST